MQTAAASASPASSRHTPSGAGPQPPARGRSVGRGSVTRAPSAGPPAPRAAAPPPSANSAAATPGPTLTAGTRPEPPARGRSVGRGPTTRAPSAGRPGAKPGAASSFASVPTPAQLTPPPLPTASGTAYPPPASQPSSTSRGVPAAQPARTREGPTPAQARCKEPAKECVIGDPHPLPPTVESPVGSVHSSPRSQKPPRSPTAASTPVSPPPPLAPVPSQSRPHSTPDVSPWAKLPVKASPRSAVSAAASPPAETATPITRKQPSAALDEVPSRELSPKNSKPPRSPTSAPPPTAPLAREAPTVPPSEPTPAPAPDLAITKPAAKALPKPTEPPAAHPAPALPHPSPSSSSEPQPTLRRSVEDHPWPEGSPKQKKSCQDPTPAAPPTPPIAVAPKGPSQLTPALPQPPVTPQSPQTQSSPRSHSAISGASTEAGKSTRPRQPADGASPEPQPTSPGTPSTTTKVAGPPAAVEQPPAIPNPVALLRQVMPHVSEKEAADALQQTSLNVTAAVELLLRSGSGAAGAMAAPRGPPPAAPRGPPPAAPRGPPPATVTTRSRSAPRASSSRPEYTTVRVDDPVGLLRQVMPHVTERQAAAALHLTDHNVTTAINLLVTIGSDESHRPPNQPGGRHTSGNAPAPALIDPKYAVGRLRQLIPNLSEEDAARVLKHTRHDVAAAVRALLNDTESRMGSAAAQPQSPGSSSSARPPPPTTDGSRPPVEQQQPATPRCPGPPAGAQTAAQAAGSQGSPRAAQLTPAEQVAKIRLVLPHVSERQAMNALAHSDQDVKAAVHLLLNQDQAEDSSGPSQRKGKRRAREPRPDQGERPPVSEVYPARASEDQQRTQARMAQTLRRAEPPPPPERSGSSGSGSSRPSSGDAEDPALPTREAAILAGRERLAQRLGHLGLQEVVMADDGHCQFRALAHQLCGSADHHEWVRARVVNHMSRNRSHYRAYFEGDDAEFEAYLDDMAEDEWGDELTLSAFADAFGVVVHVVMSAPSPWYMTWEPAGNPAAAHHVVVSYLSPVHYNAVMPATPQPTAAPTSPAPLEVIPDSDIDRFAI